jgi:hypothetical protein
VFTARYGLSPYIKQIRFVFKGLIPKYVTANSQTAVFSSLFMKRISPGTFKRLELKTRRSLRTVSVLIHTEVSCHKDFQKFYHVRSERMFLGLGRLLNNDSEALSVMESTWKLTKVVEAVCRRPTVQGPRACPRTYRSVAGRVSPKWPCVHRAR